MRSAGIRQSARYGGSCRNLRWSRRQESNLYLPLRRRPFYPLNYGGGGNRAGLIDRAYGWRPLWSRRQLTSAHDLSDAFYKGGSANLDEAALPAAGDEIDAGAAARSSASI